MSDEQYQEHLLWGITLRDGTVQKGHVFKSKDEALEAINSVKGEAVFKPFRIVNKEASNESR